MKKYYEKRLLDEQVKYRVLFKENLKMTSYEFEVNCKNVLIYILKEKYNEDYTIEDFHLVWFTKCLKNFKCTMCDLKPNQRYYELTYNGEKDELYVDIYDKQFNGTVKL